MFSVRSGNNTWTERCSHGLSLTQAPGHRCSAFPLGREGRLPGTLSQRHPQHPGSRASEQLSATDGSSNNGLSKYALYSKKHPFSLKRRRHLNLLVFVKGRFYNGGADRYLASPSELSGHSQLGPPQVSFLHLLGNTGSPLWAGSPLRHTAWGRGSHGQLAPRCGCTAAQPAQLSFSGHQRPRSKHQTLKEASFHLLHASGH